MFYWQEVIMRIKTIRVLMVIGFVLTSCSQSQNVSSSIDSSSPVSSSESSLDSSEKSFETKIKEISKGLNYTVSISGSLSKDTTTVAMNYQESYTDSGYYLLEPNTKKATGFANYDDGIFRFTYDDSKINAGHYLTKKENDIWSLDKIRSLKGMDLISSSVTDTYTMTSENDKKTIYHSSFLDKTNIPLTDITSINVINTVPGIRIQITTAYGNLKLVVSQIGSTEIPFLKEYLDSGKGPLATFEDLSTVRNLFLNENYTFDQGKKTVSDKKINIGKYRFTSNYYYYDLSDEYLNSIKGTMYEDLIKREGRIRLKKDKGTLKAGTYSFLPSYDDKNQAYLQDSNLTSLSSDYTVPYVEAIEDEDELACYEQMTTSEEGNLYVIDDSDIIQRFMNLFFSSETDTTVKDYLYAGIRISEDLLLKNKSVYFSIINYSGQAYETDAFSDFGSANASFLDDYLNY